MAEALGNRKKCLSGQQSRTVFFPLFSPFFFLSALGRALLPSATGSTGSYMCIVDISEIWASSLNGANSARHEILEEELSPPRLPAPVSASGPRMLCSAFKQPVFGLPGPEINHDEVHWEVHALF